MAVRETRGIEYDDVVLQALIRGFLHVLRGIHADALVHVAAVAVGGKVVIGPSGVGGAEVHAGDAVGESCGGVDGEASGVREKVQHVGVGAAFADEGACDGVVQEQAGIDVCGEVDLEFQAVLADGGDDRVGACLLVLGPVGTSGPVGVDDVLRVQIKHAGTDVQAGGAYVIGHGLVAEIGDLGVAAVEVHGDGITGKIAVVDAETVRARCKKFVSQCLCVVLEDLPEILVHVVHFFILYPFRKALYIIRRKKERQTENHRGAGHGRGDKSLSG